MANPCRICVGVVDDDESSCRALSRLLSADGIQAVSYLSAEAFLADTKRPQFDCLLLDIQLGGMSGIELHQALKAAGSNIPVIYITAQDQPEIRERAEAVGCAAYFHKTAPGAEVRRAIRSVTTPDGAGSEREGGASPARPDGKEMA